AVPGPPPAEPQADLPPSPDAPGAVKVDAPQPAARGPRPKDPGAEKPEPEHAGSVEELYRRALKRHESIDSFTARLQRRECGRTGPKPLELLLFKYRKTPLSIHFKWVGEEGRGREVLWVEGKYDNKIQIRTAAGDVPLMPAGQRLALSPTSPLVRAQSRHHIREAGMTGTLEMLARKLRAQEMNPSVPLLKYLGPAERPEYPYPLDGLEVTMSPDEEDCLPEGGTRYVYFDPMPGSPSFGLPVVFVTNDRSGRTVEYYCFDRFLCPVRLDDRDFDPDVLWPETPHRRADPARGRRE
ncbi:MAG TPA: DUF1571 domain-containing protein, partial [Gemmataceae bacterium]